jgi:3-carboxy-cis,cis-muconate cycloisomerase
MARTVVAEGRHLRDVVRDRLRAEPDLFSGLDAARLDALFDPVAAAAPATRLAQRQLDHLKPLYGMDIA